MSGFANAIIGGAEKLIRKAIRSPDYQPGALGWSINKDGSAEFNDAEFRGEILVGPPGSQQVHIYTSGGAGVVSFPSNSPTEAAQSVMQSAILDPGSASEVIAMLIEGGWETGPHDDSVTIKLFSEARDGSIPAKLEISVGPVGFLSFESHQVFFSGVPFFDQNHAWSWTTITPVANTPTSTVVISPSSLIQGLGSYGVIATAVTAFPGIAPNGNVVEVSASAITGTSFTLWIFRTNTTMTTIDYVWYGVI